MASFVLKSAFIQFTETFPLPVPNVILFQYNPETVSHSWTPATSTRHISQAAGNPLAISGQPQESFSFTLMMDANDAIADGDPVQSASASATGVYPRLAALEMLLFPAAARGTGLVGTVSSALGITARASKTVPARTLPLIFWVHGPGRILPVRVASLTITEKLYDSDLLNPTHVEAQVQLSVLTEDELKEVKGALGKVAKGAYAYTQRLRQTLALANLDNDVSSIIGMLPV
jgi:hypothetical protein